MPQLINQDVSLENLYQAVNRFSALVEQYDMLDQSQAQVEMQNEIVQRIPDNKRQPNILQQVGDQLSNAETHKDAVTRTIRDITGKDIGELRQRVTDLKLALSRYSEIEVEHLKTKQAFEILAASNGFDIEEGEGGSRKEFERELTSLRQNKEFLLTYLRDAIFACLSTTSFAKPKDSVLNPLLQIKEKKASN